MLNEEYEYFQSARDKLVKDHFEEYVVIQDKKILGFYSTEEKAFESMESHDLGTFFVAQCVPEDEHEHRFHSRVAFV